MLVRLSILFCLALGWMGHAAARQDQPRLWRAGPAPANQPRGNLEGFRVAVRVKPFLSRNQLLRAQGSRAAARVTVIAGKPAKIELREGSGPLARAVRNALRKWRFEMPRDGTSPVIFDALYQCAGGKVEEDSITASLAPSGL